MAEALKRVTKLANEINAAMEKIQNLEKLLALESQFISRAPIGLVLPNRTIERDGMLDKVCRKGVKKRRFVVLSDLIVYGSPLPGAKEKWVFSRCIDLKDPRVKIEHVAPQHEREFGFAILSAEKSFIVLCESQFQLTAWMSKIQECADAARARELARPVSMAGPVPEQREPSDLAPVWVEDSLASACVICGCKFTTFKRRHHCRQCGRCICGKDSPYRRVLSFAGSSSKAVRICVICHEAGEDSKGSKDAMAQVRASSAMFNLDSDSDRPYSAPSQSPSGVYDGARENYTPPKQRSKSNKMDKTTGGRTAKSSRQRPLPQPKKG